MPRVQSIILECPSAAGPLGAMGIGEASLTPVAAGTAITDTTGRRVADLLITPEKVVCAPGMATAA